MNKYVKASIASLAVASILFLLMAFINANINPFKWSIAARFLLSFFTFISGVVTFRFTLAQVEYDIAQDMKVKWFEVSLKEKIVSDIHRPNNHELVGKIMSEGIDLSKLNKEDFKNL